MCSGNGKPNPPHPACPPIATAAPSSTFGQSRKGADYAYPSTSRWSGYRFHERDPLWFENGVQLLVRNGDVGGPVSYGSAKCYNVRACTCVHWCFAFAHVHVRARASDLPATTLWDAISAV